MRLLLKLSGEALSGEGEHASIVAPGAVDELVTEIGEFLAGGGELAVVLGGGNILRGANLAQAGVERVTADQMGTLATVMNGLAFKDLLRQAGIPVALFSAVAVPGIAQGYSRDAAVHALRSGQVAILAGGTGNPLFTTDTAATLRAIEIGAERVCKATKVDGVYSEDPKLNPDAVRYDTISFAEVIERELGVMDLPAICLCRDHQMPILVFDMTERGALKKVGAGEQVGTLVI